MAGTVPVDLSCSGWPSQKKKTMKTLKCNYLKILYLHNRILLTQEEEWHPVIYQVKGC